MLEDVKINVRDGYIGVQQAGFTSSGNYNMEIIGGKYGIYDPSMRFPAFFGLKMSGQTDRAIYKHGSDGALNIVGFEITKTSAPVISARMASRLPGPLFHQGQVLQNFQPLRCRSRASLPGEASAVPQPA